VAGALTPEGRLARVILVNRYFHPDHSATSQMASDLAFALARSGAEVAVVTGRQTYEDPSALLPARETVDGVAIRRVGGSRFGRGRLVGRVFDYASFATGAAWVLARTARRRDRATPRGKPSVARGVGARRPRGRRRR